MRLLEKIKRELDLPVLTDSPEACFLGLGEGNFLTLGQIFTFTDNLQQGGGVFFSDPGSAVAADDADDVGWFTPAEVRSLDCVPGLVAALEDWGVLGR